MTRVLKIDPVSPQPDILNEALDALRKGGIVAFPTDTVYGLGCDPWMEEAVEKIYEAKGRGRKPLPIIADSVSRAEDLGVFNHRAKMLVSEFWPGPLTIKIFPRREVPPYLLDEDGRVAIRVPDHPVPLELARGLGGYIVGTSANRSGSPSPVTVEEVLTQLHNIDLILDGGPTTYKSPSTIIDVTRNPPIVLRIGAVAPEDMERVLGETVNISII